MAAEPAGRQPGDAVVRGTIHGRVLLSVGLLFFCAMVLLALAAQAYGRRAADLSFDRLLSASLLAMGETVGPGAAGAADASGGWDMDLPYAALDMLAMAPDDRVFYSLRGPSGELVTGYGDLPSAPDALRAQAGLRDGSPVFFDADYHGESTRFALAGRWAAGLPDQGRAWLQVGQTRRARDALAAEIAGTATLAIALFTVAALALCWWGVRRALAPLGRLEHELATREAADLQAIATPVPAEMAQAVGALNRFMARLATNLDTLKIFIAEAAHQMRTPLAALRAQAQMALDEPDAAEQRRGLEAVERNAAQLTRLLNQLLADASVEHRDTLRRFGPVDLVRIVREALQDVVPRAEPRPVVRFEFGAGIDTAPMQGDALMLREAIKNLVDNALRHGVGPIPRGSDTASGSGVVAEVDLRLERIGHRNAATCLFTDAPAAPGATRLPVPASATIPTGSTWRLTVADRGPGIDPGQIGNVFERFGRGPAAAAGGAGLGLAIVRKVVASHHGAIALLPRPGGGLLVQLDFAAGALP